MARTREIKRRIKSIDNTRQITRTMEMVAGAKIRKSQERIENSRPYTTKMMEVLANLSSYVKAGKHPLLEVHEKQERVYVLSITSNRGLCGAFNTNIIRKTESILEREKQAEREVVLSVAGQKGINYFKYRGYELLSEYTEIGDSPKFEDAREIAAKVMEMYINHEVDKVLIIFNHFKSVMDQRPIEYNILPIEKDMTEGEKERVVRDDYIFEPSPEKVLYELLPTYVETLVYRTLMESVASEHGARRTAMKAASDNAVEMIGQLTRTFNRARQAQITQEISEIVGGAEALK